MKSKYISVPKKEYEELQSQLEEKEKLLSQLKAILKEIVTDNDVLCTICLEKLQNPCILPDCLHRFCKDCLHRSILKCSSNCPACRKRITNRRDGLHEDRSFHRVLQKLFTMVEIVDPDQEKSNDEKDEKNSNKKIKIDEVQSDPKIKAEVKKEKDTKTHVVKKKKTIVKYQPPQRNYIGVARSRDKYKATITYTGKTFIIRNKYELASDAAQIFDRAVKILKMDHKTNFYNSLHWKKAREEELIENLKKEVGEDNLIGIDLSKISKSVDPAFPTDDELRVKFGLMDEKSRRKENGVYQQKRVEKAIDKKRTLTKKPRMKNQPQPENRKSDRLKKEVVVKIEQSSHATSSYHSKSKSGPSSIIVGTKVLKDFGEHGVFEGTVTSLPDSRSRYYHVTYSDGDGEDLSLSQIEPLVAAYEAKAMDRNIQEGSTLQSDLRSNLDEVSNSNKTSSISRRSKRSSTNGIDETPTPPCLNSEEDMSMPDLVAPSSKDVIVLSKAADRTSLKLSKDSDQISNSSQLSGDSESECSSESASSSENDSDSDSENAIDQQKRVEKAIDKKRTLTKKPRMKNQPQPENRKSDRLKKEVVVKIEQSSHATSSYHSKSKSGPSSIIVGTKVLKDFGEHGVFEGTITSLPDYRSRYYHVTYSDGDGEDLFLSQIEPLVAAYEAKAMDRNIQEGSTLQSDLRSNLDEVSNSNKTSSISRRSKRSSVNGIDETPTPTCLNSEEDMSMPDLVAPSSKDVIVLSKAADRTSLKLSKDSDQISNSSQLSGDSESECSSESASSSENDSDSDSENAIDDCPATPVKEIMPLPALVTPSREEMAAYNEKCSDDDIFCSASNTTKIQKDSVIMTSSVEEAAGGLRNEIESDHLSKIDEWDINMPVEKTLPDDDFPVYKDIFRSLRYRKPERFIKLKRKLPVSNKIDRCTKSLKSQHLSMVCSYIRPQSISNEENSDSPQKNDVKDATKKTHCDGKRQNPNLLKRKKCFAEGCNVNTHLRPCTGCNIAKYCSKRCQEKHWYRHKERCRNIGNTSVPKSQPEEIKRDSCSEDQNLLQTRLIYKFLVFTASFRK